MNDKKDLDLIIGKNRTEKAENYIKIPEESRFLNTVVIGTNHSGKTSKILPALAYQQISNGSNTTGCTFIVNNREEAFFIASLAQRLKRKTQLKIIKPSADLNTYQELIKNKEYNYEEMTKLIDYKQEIRNKSIVIIDLEINKYKDSSKMLLRKLLKHLYIDIQNVDVTLNRQHYLFIDDADEYIEDLEEILEYGDELNLATMLFINSFSKLNDNKKYIIEKNIKNYILLANLIKEDINYFAERYSIFNIAKQEDAENFDLILIKYKRLLALRPGNSIHYEIIIDRESNKREFGKCSFYNEYLKDEKQRESIYGIAKKIKKKNIIPDNNIPFKIEIDDFNKKFYPNSLEVEKSENSIESKPLSVKPTKNENIVAEAILDNINDIPELYNEETSSFDIDEMLIKNEVPITSENETIKKKKKKKKKKHNNQNEIILENTNENKNIDNKKEDNKLSNETINKVDENINKNQIDDEIIQFNPIEEYGHFNEYNIVEDDMEEPYLIEENNAIIDNNDDLLINVKNKPQKQERTIEDEFNDSIEGFAENEIKEEAKKTENKTYFDIDSLFDDEDE